MDTLKNNHDHALLDLLRDEFPVSDFDCSVVPGFQCELEKEFVVSHFVGKMWDEIEFDPDSDRPRDVYICLTLESRIHLLPAYVYNAVLNEIHELALLDCLEDKLVIGRLTISQKQAVIRVIDELIDSSVRYSDKVSVTFSWRVWALRRAKRRLAR